MKMKRRFFIYLSSVGKWEVSAKDIKLLIIGAFISLLISTVQTACLAGRIADLLGGR